jgi:hypothetical protein
MDRPNNDKQARDPTPPHGGGVATLV